MCDGKRQPVPREIHESFALELAVMDERLRARLETMAKAGMILKNQDKIVHVRNQIRRLKEAFSQHWTANNPSPAPDLYYTPAIRELAEQIAAELGAEISKRIAVTSSTGYPAA